MGKKQQARNQPDKGAVTTPAPKEEGEMEKSYAQTMKGIGLLCLDQLAFHRKVYNEMNADPQADDFSIGIANGRCYAYSEIIRHITGCRDIDKAREIINFCP